MKDQRPFLEYATPEQQNYNGLAIASFTCAMISLCSVLLPLCITIVVSSSDSELIRLAGCMTCCIIPVGAVASLSLGIGALASASPEWDQPFRGRWMALTGIIYGVLFLLLASVIMLLGIFTQ